GPPAAPAAQRSALLRTDELPLQALPVRVVVALEEVCLQREPRWPQRQLGLEEKRHRVVEIRRLELRAAPTLVGCRVGAVPRHAVVQAGTAGPEGVAFADVVAGDEAQELARHVAVERRRTEGVLGHRPARREAPELDV